MKKQNLRNLFTTLIQKVRASRTLVELYETHLDIRAFEATPFAPQFRKLHERCVSLLKCFRDSREDHISEAFNIRHGKYS